MKKYFLTFADRRLSLSAERIKQQARSMSVFDHIISLDETNLDEDFLKIFSNKLVYGTKGFGYMCWKSQVILQTLNLMSEGDILQWTDVDCHLNINGKQRLLEYFDIVDQSILGLLCFDSNPPNDPTLLKNIILLNQIDRKFTKGDVFDFFNVRYDQRITDTEMIISGSFFIKKSKHSVDLIKQWAEVPKINFNLIDDSPSIGENLEGFLHHKHDQSIFSILCKLNNVQTISFYETCYPTEFNPISHRVSVSFDLLDKYPLHHKGDKVFSEIENISFEYTRRNK